MTREELQALLEAGSITQEQFDRLVAEGEGAAHTGGGEAKEEDKSKVDKLEEEMIKKEEEKEKARESGISSAEIERMVQSAVDRATNKLGNENKELRDELKNLQREKLSDEELRQLELKEKEAEIAKKEKALARQENQMHAIKAMKKAGLDDGSDSALDFLDFVAADTPEETDKRVAAVAAYLAKQVKAKVEETFKAHGRVPEKGSDGSGEENPYSKLEWNMTKQAELEQKDPERAKALEAAAKQG